VVSPQMLLMIEQSAIAKIRAAFSESDAELLSEIFSEECVQ
jgi:hypothetical protein